MRDFSSWREPGSDADVLHQKATVLRSLFEITPAGEDRDRIVAACAMLLASSDAERQNPAEWLWQVKALIQAAGADGPKLVKLLRASGDPGMVMLDQGFSMGTSK